MEKQLWRKRHTLQRKPNFTFHRLFRFQGSQILWTCFGTTISKFLSDKGISMYVNADSRSQTPT